MTTGGTPPPDVTVRVLRAKVGELEGWLANASSAGLGVPVEPVDYLAADLALVASALADLIERVGRGRTGPPRGSLAPVASTFFPRGIGSTPPLGEWIPRALDAEPARVAAWARSVQGHHVELPDERCSLCEVGWPCDTYLLAGALLTVLRPTLADDDNA